MLNYFETLCEKNRLARKHKFKFCKVTNIYTLEDAIANMSRHSAFFCVDTVVDGFVVQGNGGGFAERITYVVYLLKSAKIDDADSIYKEMEICRQLRRQICSRLLADSLTMEELNYLNKDRMNFRELDTAVLSGCTGTYITFSVDHPLDLIMEEDEWDEK